MKLTQLIITLLFTQVSQAADVIEATAKFAARARFTTVSGPLKFGFRGAGRSRELVVPASADDAVDAGYVMQLPETHGDDVTATAFKRGSRPAVEEAFSTVSREIVRTSEYKPLKSGEMLFRQTASQETKLYLKKSSRKSPEHKSIWIFNDRSLGISEQLSTDSIQRISQWDLPDSIPGVLVDYRITSERVETVVADNGQLTRYEFSRSNPSFVKQPLTQAEAHAYTVRVAAKSTVATTPVRGMTIDFPTPTR